jgi:hypothetical protein
MELYNLQGLREMSGGDNEFVTQVIQMTLEDLPQVIEGLHQGVENQNWNMVFQVAHKIKPTMQTIGVNPDIWNNILLINDYTKNLKNLNEIPKLVELLMENLKTISTNLAKEL